MPESTQHKLDRIRPPRVQITYDVQVGDAIVKKELPFVAGIMADLSGARDPEKPLPPLRDRKFIEIDRDNFNEVLASINPRITAKAEIAVNKNDVAYKLTDDLLKALDGITAVTDEMKRKLKDSLPLNGHRPIMSKARFMQLLKDTLGKDLYDNLSQETKDLAKVQTTPWLARFNGSLTDKSTLTSTLKFQHLDDFAPAKVLNQVEVLRNLFDARQRLSDLLTKLDGNDNLAHILQVIAQKIVAEKVLDEATFEPTLTDDQKNNLLTEPQRTALGSLKNELK